MTEFELVEMYYLNGDDVFDQFVGYSTAVFAYFVAGHLVAANLSRFAAIGLTALYTVFLTLPLGSVIQAYSQLEKLVSYYYQQYPDGWAIPKLGHAVHGAYPILFVFVLFWLASVYYVHFIVRGAVSSHQENP